MKSSRRESGKDARMRERLMERKTNMDASGISGAIQSHPDEIVYQTTQPKIVLSGDPSSEIGSPAHPTIEMLKRISPSSARDILDFIGSQAKPVHGASDIYRRPGPDAAQTNDAGLITAHTHSGLHSSSKSPVAPAVPAFGGGAGADFSYRSPTEQTLMKGSKSTEAPSTVSVLV